MRGFSRLQRFTRGIVSDAIGVRGALLEADDVVPLERGEGYRTRGGKPVTVVTAASGAATWHTYTGGRYLWDMNGNACQLASGSNAALALHLGDTASGVRLGLISDDAKGYALPSQALDHAGAALTFAGRTNLYSTQLGGSYGNGAFFHEELLVPMRATSGIGFRYAGNPPVVGAVPYSTGTVSGSSGDATLTGSGTSWNGAMVGAYVYINDADTSERPYRIVSVASTTSMELDRPLGGAVTAGTSYRIDSVAPWVCKPGTFGAQNYASVITSRSTVAALGAVQHQGRVFVWDTIDADNRRYPDRLRWSSPIAETDGHWGGGELFDPNAFADAFPGEGGTHNSAGVQQCVSHRGTLYIFKAAAIYVLRGYVASDGSDEGASIERIATIPGQLASRAVAADEGILFASTRGLMLLSDGGLVNLSERAGAQQLFEDVVGAGVWSFSVLEDRVVMQSGGSLAAAVSSGDPNTLVWDRKRQTFTTQTTLATTRIVSPWSSGIELATALAAESSSIEGEFVEWQGDNDFTTLVAEDSRYPLLRMTSHPISVQATGLPSARVRTLQVKAKVVDTDTTDPVLGVSLLLGEEGTRTAVEAAIAAASDAEEITTTEKWYRLPVRAGTPPVDSVRVRLVQEQGSRDIRVTEAGVESVGVARFR